MFCASKTVSYAIIVFINFLTGVEYAVILPTALQYLQKFGGDEFYLGLCLSAYSFSSLFSSPIMGKMTDKLGNPKAVMLFSNVWQIIGSFMYFVGYYFESKWVLIGGRLVAGIGLGVIACCFSETVKATQPEERGKMLARIMMGRQVGLILGPSANFVFLKVKTYIGPFYLDNLSAPGLLMAGLWLLLEIVMVFFYTNLSEFSKKKQPELVDQSIDDQVNDERPHFLVNESDENRALLSEHTPASSSHSRYHSFSQTNKMENSFHETSENEITNVNDTNEIRLRVVDNSQTDSFFVRFYNEYIKEEVIAVLSITFTCFFMQTALETLVTPLTRQYFNWTDAENSILYAVAGVEILLVFLLLSFLTKRVSERVLLLIGLIGNLMTLVFLLVYVPHAKIGDASTKALLLFMFPVFGNLFSLPFIALGSISILSKLTSMETQGQTQGIRRTIAGLSTIFGPIWAGVFYGQWYILFSSLAALVSMSLIMVIISYKHLETRTATQTQSS